jgi:hypothetical protein
MVPKADDKEESKNKLQTIMKTIYTKTARKMPQLSC